MKFALIKDGLVDNVFEAKNYRDSMIVANAHGGEAVNIDQYNAGIGYSYKDGNFYTPAGKVVPRILTMAEEFEVMKAALDELIMGGM